MAAYFTISLSEGIEILSLHVDMHCRLPLLQFFVLSFKPFSGK